MAVDLEVELLRVRMKSVQYESSLLKDVVHLQRMRIAELERQLEDERAYRIAHRSAADKDGCRHCGLPTPVGQIFCARPCWTAYHQMRKASGATDAERGTRRDDT